MTDDRHVRIYDDGEQVELDAMYSMYEFDPKIPGDEERAEREKREYNQRVHKELRKKGLDTMSKTPSLNDVSLPGLSDKG